MSSLQGSPQSPRRHNRHSRRRFAFAAATATLAGALGIGLAGGEMDVAVPAATNIADAGTVRLTTHGAPMSPPAPMCGSARLRGPERRPDDAVVVRPAQHLGEVVASHPPGTRFWLRSGVHKLEREPYDQVIPKRGDVFVGAPGAVLDGQNVNRYAFGGSAPGVRIRHLTIRNFGSSGHNNNEGVVNHDAARGWKIKYNTITRNAGAGLFVGSHNVVSHNCLSRNGQYGFSAYHPDGLRNVVVRHNEIAHNNTDEWERRRPHCGCSGGGKFWATRNATVVNNWVHDNRSVGLWMDNNNAGFLVEGNLIADNAAEGLIYETSYNALIRRNSFVRNALREGPKDHGFPIPALYISESGSDSRAGPRYAQEFRIAHNRFVDNWSGVVGWENADRFAGSPANTSTGETTLVNPDVATEEACSNPDLISQQPYYDDCRWKTTRLRVTNNVFEFDPARIGARCTADNKCGYVGLFSNWGTYPPWSPYHGDVVEDNITFHQDNRWMRNTYVGPWRYMVHELGKRVSWRTWRSSPYGQDVESTRD